MSVEDVAAGLNALIAMCAKSCGMGSEEVERLEADLQALLNGEVAVEEYFWVAQMLGA